MKPGGNWEPTSGSTTTRGPIRPWGYRTPAKVFHQVTDVGEEGAVQAKESRIDQTLVSLAGAAGLSLNSTSVLSN